MTDVQERRRRLRPEARRALIVEAAADEFGRRGHHEARLEDIARAAGTTKAVIYDHFPDKGALHAEVVARANRDLVAAVVAAVGPFAAGESRERYRAGILAAFELIVRRPDVRMLLLGSPGAAREVGRRAAEAQREARAAMTALYLTEPSFLRGAPDREERASHIAQAAIGTMNGLAVLGVEEGLSPERLTDLAMDVLWPGIEAQMRAAD